MEMRQALERLSAVPGPSGFEGHAAALAAELLGPLVDEVSIDRMGNVIGVRRCGRPGAKRLLLDAHLDEIGLMVTGVEDGFLHFRTIGGVDPRMLPDRELTVLTDPPILGVVACLPPHVQKAGDSKKSIPISDLRIDVGMSQEEAERAVPVGTPVVFRGGCTPLGEGKLCGKAMDDRACFVTLLRCAQLLRDKPLDVDVYFMGSTMEETSSAGAKTGTFALEPDWCVAVDVTHGKTPDASPKDYTLVLGEGPVIGVGPNCTRWMTERLKAKARALELSYQLEVMPGHSGTNAWYLQISREGVATAVLSLPLRYMHSPIEVLDWKDVEGVAALLAAFARDLGKEAETLC